MYCLIYGKLLIATLKLRIIRYLGFCFLCGIVLSAHAEGTTILIVGDSLSAAYGIPTEKGWVALLGQKLDEQPSPARLINASISGETTGGGLSRLEPLLKQHRPDLVIIELGANDGLRGFPARVIEQNLDQMISLSRQYKAKVLLIGVEIPLNYGSRYTEAFKKVFESQAKKHQIPLLPSLLGDIPLQSELMQPDGLHPTSAAQPLILDRVWPLLSKLLRSKNKN